MENLEQKVWMIMKKVQRLEMTAEEGKRAVIRIMEVKKNEEN